MDAQLDVDMPPQDKEGSWDELLPLRKAWEATELLFTVKADRLGFARLKGPCRGGKHALLWAVYRSPPEHDESRALRRLRPSLQTVEYAAGWEWVERNLAEVPYGTWLWVRR